MRWFALVAVLTLTACGEDSSNDMSPDERFRECSSLGGSYKDDGYDEWECDLPDAQPTVTVTVTESESAF